VLYAAEITGRPIAELWGDPQVIDPRARASDYTGRLVTRVGADLPRIDALIAAHSHGWATERMAVLDRSILRIAVAELLDDPAVPAGVAINEAVELARELSTDESPGFINGVLGAIAAGLGEAGLSPERAGPG